MKYFGLLLLLLLIQKGSHADISAPPEPLPLQLLQADEVVLAVPSLDEGETTDAAHRPRIGVESMRDGGELTLYVCSVESVLKGKDIPSLAVALPKKTTTMYGDIALPALSSGKVLLLLRQNGQGGWEPVDPQTPFIPLLEKSALSSEAQSLSTEKKAVQLILASTADAALRPYLTFLLRPVIGTSVVEGLRPLMESPDLAVRDNVLFTLATNQQVSAIPRIVELNSEMEKDDGSNAMSLLALENLKSRQAVPLLNPLLCNPDPLVRQESALALRRLANRTSIPLLISGLKEPDPQDITRYEIYATLHRLIPALGQPKDLPAFSANQAAELQPIYDWWADHKRD